MKSKYGTRYELSDQYKFAFDVTFVANNSRRAWPAYAFPRYFSDHFDGSVTSLAPPMSELRERKVETLGTSLLPGTAMKKLVGRASTAVPVRVNELSAHHGTGVDHDRLPFYEVENKSLKRGFRGATGGDNVFGFHEVLLPPKATTEAWQGL
jgi:hypothetical protein